jgi:hypothetical protein
MWATAMDISTSVFASFAEYHFTESCVLESIFS